MKFDTLPKTHYEIALDKDVRKDLPNFKKNHSNVDFDHIQSSILEKILDLKLNMMAIDMLNGDPPNMSVDFIDNVVRQVQYTLREDALIPEKYVPHGVPKFGYPKGFSNFGTSWLIPAWIMYNTAEPLYYMPSNTLGVFISTDCTIPFKDIKFPHKAFYIHFPDNKICHMTTGHNDTFEKFAIDSSVKVNGKNNFVSTGHEKLFSVIGFYVTVYGEKEDKVMFSFVDDWKNAGEDDQKINTYPITLERDDSSPGGYKALVKWADNGDCDIDDTGKFLIDLALVTTVYLTGQKPDLFPLIPKGIIKKRDAIKNPKKLRRFDREHENVSLKKVVVIGPNFEKLDLLPDPSAKGLYKFSHKSLVRGHFRHQPYGPRENTLYKTIWIKPYIKGPEDGVLIKKKSIIKTGESLDLS